MTGKAYHKYQISRKCLGKIFASILRFVVFLRAGTEESDPQNDIMWFPWTESDKFGTVKSGLTGKAYHKCQISRKCFGKIFASILRFVFFLSARTEDPKMA